MKIKALVPIFFSILVGFLFGRVIFDNYSKKSVLAFNEGEKVYLVKLASYDSLEEIENSKSLLVLSNDSSYNLYAGITKQKDNANKIINYYKDSYKDITIDTLYVNDLKFLTELKEYDKLVSIVTKKDDLISIESIILANYKEVLNET